MVSDEKIKRREKNYLCIILILLVLTCQLFVFKLIHLEVLKRFIGYEYVPNTVVCENQGVRDFGLACIL